MFIIKIALIHKMYSNFKTQRKSYNHFSFLKWLKNHKYKLYFNNYRNYY